VSPSSKTHRIHFFGSHELPNRRQSLQTAGGFALDVRWHRAGFVPVLGSPLFAASGVGCGWLQRAARLAPL
jgi:hypothetical protein